MRKVFKELCRVFKKAPGKISLILIMDLFGAIINAVNPYIIGACIDELLAHKYRYLLWFIILQILLISLRTIDKILDTRTYNKIIEEESINHYEAFIRTDADDSKISSLLNQVDEVPNFLEVNLFNYINMAAGIIISLYYIFSESGILVFLLAISFSVAIPFVTYPHRKIIVLNNKTEKDWDEDWENIIAGRTIGKYKNHITKVLSLGIVSSDLDAKIYLITAVLQAVLLGVAIYSTMHAGGYTSGQLFSTITYVMMLNEYIKEINDVIIEVKDLEDTIFRLESNS